MPRRMRAHRRKRVRTTVRRTRRHKKNLNFNANSNQVTYLSRRHLPYPREFTAKFEAYADFFLPASYTMNNLLYNVPLNYINLPFESMYDASFPFQTFPIAKNVQPTGLAYFWTPSSDSDTVPMYSNFTVLSSKLTVELHPTSSLDVIEISLTPAFYNVLRNLASGTKLPTIVQTASQPFTKYKMIELNKGSSIISNKIKVWRLLGISKRAYMDDLSGKYDGIAGANPTEIQQWFISWNNIAATYPSSSNSTLCGRIRIQYEVQLWNSVNNPTIETVVVPVGTSSFPLGPTGATGGRFGP